MSLINEALKRARDEAVRREASTKGIPLAPAAPTRERNRWLPILVLGLTLALVVSLVVTVNLASKLPAVTQTAAMEDAARVEPMAETELEPVVSASTEAAPTTPVVAPSDPVPAMVEPAPPRQESPRPQDSPPARESPLAQQTSSARPQAGPAAQLETVEPRSPSPTQQVASPDRPVEAEGRVFVLSAELAGGQSVDLGGIAWSETGPYALLNGRVVGLGEWVQGYRVSQIDPGQVILERDDDRVVVRLK